MFNSRVSNYFGSPFDDNIHFPYLENPNQEWYDRLSLGLKPENLDKFKDSTLLYIFYSKDRHALHAQVAQILFKKQFQFYKKYD